MRTYRYQGTLLDDKAKAGAVPVRLDFGFKFYAVQYLVVSEKLNPGENRVFDIVESNAKNKRIFKAEIVHDPSARLYRYYATVDKIYDGDTITQATIDLGFDAQFVNTIRLSGIDTPEIRGAERESGLISKARLVELILGKEIVIETEKDHTGKYGRYLGRIFVDDVDVNQLLVDEGLAEPYL